jgi:hypothetical protein
VAIASLRPGACPPADLTAAVTVLARAARADEDDAASRARALWMTAMADGVRIPVGAVRVSGADPRLLGVHAAIAVPGAPEDQLPKYVPRDADGGEPGIRVKIAAAAERGGFLVLVGGSSVGKTRCAYEAVRAAAGLVAGAVGVPSAGQSCATEQSLPSAATAS